MEKNFAPDEQVRVWMGHLQNVSGSVSHALITEAIFHVSSPECFGYDQGQIRPGLLGKWDLLYTLCPGGSKDTEVLLLCGLTESQVNQEELEFEAGTNDPTELAEYIEIKNMTPNELDAEIERLERLLGPYDKKGTSNSFGDSTF